MPVRIAVLMWLGACTCHGTDLDLDVSAGGECDELSLLQVGVAVSKRPDGAANSIRAGAQSALSLTSELPLLDRPGFEGNKLDLIEFGILLKDWYGISENEGEVTVDAVVTLYWSDPRATKLIPSSAKATSVTISGDSAKGKMWLPNVLVTNIAHGGRDLISSSVKITSSGSITMVDRVLLTLKQTMETENFPFDAQEVNIKIASATYMRDEVELVPIKDKSEWGVPSDTDIFSNSMWYFVKDSLTAIVEIDGELAKSRGVLSIMVHRCLSEFVNAVFMPSVVLLCMTWSAFWLPLAGPYVMPRVALNAFALLCQLSVSQVVDSKIPHTGGRTWMTEYLGLCILLQFTLALLNVIILAIEHTGTGDGGHNLAVQLNYQMIKSYPISTTLNISILAAGYLTASRACLAVTLIGYMAYLGLSYRYRLQDKQDSAG